MYLTSSYIYSLVRQIIIATEVELCRDEEMNGIEAIRMRQMEEKWLNDEHAVNVLF